MLVFGLGDGRYPLGSWCEPQGIGARVRGGGLVAPARDAKGNTVHLVMALPTKWSFDGTSPIYELEFDAGDYVIPPGGTLYLTGGDRTATYDVDVWRLPAFTLPARPGPLSVVSTGAYVVPMSHNLLIAGSAGAFNVDGYILNLIGGQRVPIPGGANVTVAAGVSFSTQPAYQEA